MSIKILIKKLKESWLKSKSIHAFSPKIIPSSKHHLPDQFISPNALKVLKRLKDHGFGAYLVGGGVRDLLLNKIPKDFDVATDARPEQVKQLFRNAFLIGRRFRLVHIRFSKEIIEVTTFRADDRHWAARKRWITAQGMLLRDNTYGSLSEDAGRRDFTINALYYDASDASLWDYWGGLSDLEKKQICIIGDPQKRYQEDPVRLLRAIRFSSKLDFQLTEKTAQPISDLAALIQYVSPARLFDETIKLFFSGHAEKSYFLLKQYHLFEELFPPVRFCVAQASSQALFTAVCRYLDQRFLEEQPVSAYFLFSVLLWPAIQVWCNKLIGQAYSPFEAFQEAVRGILLEQRKRLTLPRYSSSKMKILWELQRRLRLRRASQISRLLNHPYFPIACDFLLLCAEANEVPGNLVLWWTRLAQADESQREQWIQEWKQANRSSQKHPKSEEKLFPE